MTIQIYITFACAVELVLKIILSSCTRRRRSKASKKKKYNSLSRRHNYLDYQGQGCQKCVRLTHVHAFLQQYPWINFFLFDLFYFGQISRICLMKSWQNCYTCVNENYMAIVSLRAFCSLIDEVEVQSTWNLVHMFPMVWSF